MRSVPVAYKQCTGVSWHAGGQRARRGECCCCACCAVDGWRAHVLTARPAPLPFALPSLLLFFSSLQLYDQRKTTLIQAHEAALACMALSASGCRLATASEKGTLLRVYDTSTGELLQEVRRGADKADIYSLAFSANATLLACTSDKGTVHIFKLREAVWESSGSGSSSSGAGAGAGAGASGNTTTGTSGAGTGPSSSGAAANSSGASGDRAGNGGSGAGGAGASAAAPGTSSSAARGGVAAASGSSTGGAPGSSTGGGGVPPAAAASSAAAEGDAAHAGGAGGAGGGSGGFAFMKQILPKYFTSEWSYAQFRVPDTKSICAFGHEPNSILGEYQADAMQLPLCRSYSLARSFVPYLPRLAVQWLALMAASSKPTLRKAERPRVLLMPPLRAVAAG